jgi:hypothetical protein
MQHLKSHTVVKPKRPVWDGRETEIHFYEYKGQYFRSQYVLETEEEYQEELETRSVTYTTQEESLDAFYEVVEKQEAILLK